MNAEELTRYCQQSGLCEVLLSGWYRVWRLEGVKGLRFRMIENTSSQAKPEHVDIPQSELFYLDNEKKSGRPVAFYDEKPLGIVGKPTGREKADTPPKTYLVDLGGKHGPFMVLTQ